MTMNSIWELSAGDFTVQNDAEMVHRDLLLLEEVLSEFSEE